jgi:hypothetical protein
VKFIGSRAVAQAPALRRLSAPWRWSLWSLLVALVAALLVTLVWLAGRYEASQVQSKLERDTADAVSDIRNALTRNIQTLQALQAGNPTPERWQAEAATLLREHREWLRVEWRDAKLVPVLTADIALPPAGVCAAGARQRPGRRGAGLQQRAPHQRRRPIPPAISCRKSTAWAWR